MGCIDGQSGRLLHPAANAGQDETKKNGCGPVSGELRSPAHVLHRPALVGFLSCAAGITLARTLGARSLPDLLLSACLCLLAGILAYFLRSGSKTLSHILGILSLASFGFLLLSSREYAFNHSQLNRLASAYSAEALIYGKVLTTPEPTT